VEDPRTRLELQVRKDEHGRKLRRWRRSGFGKAGVNRVGY
jgi:hypothetical protein